MPPINLEKKETKRPGKGNGLNQVASKNLQSNFDELPNHPPQDQIHREYSRPADSSVRNSQGIVNSIINEINHGDFNKALEITQSILSKDSANAEAWFLAGLCYHELGNIEKAINAVKNSISLNTKEPRYHYIYGLVLQNCGKYVEAKSQYDLALQYDPDYKDAHNALQLLEKKTNIKSSGTQTKKPSTTSTHIDNSAVKKALRKLLGCLVLIILVFLSFAVLPSVLKTCVSYIDDVLSENQQSVEWGMVAYTHGTVNIREDRSTNSRIIGTVSPGQSIKVDFLEDDFYAIFDINEPDRDLSKRIGFVYASLVFEKTLGEQDDPALSDVEE